MNPSLQGWNIFGYPILVIDTGRQEPEKVLNRPTLWDLRRIIGLLYITNIVVVKEIAGNPCVMGASLVWPKDVGDSECSGRVPGGVPNSCRCKNVR